MRDSVPSELAALDTAAHADRAAPDAVLPPRPTASGALADWPRQCLAGEVLESQLAYWRAALADLPPVLALPVDRARAPVQSLRGARLTTAIPAELSARLKALGQARGATLFMTLLAAFQVLLARHGAGPDIPVGTLVANPTRSAAQGLVGRSVNTLVLRGRLDPDLPFTALLARTRETVLAAFDRQDLPFETLVEALNPPRSLSHGPLVQTMLVVQDTDSLDPTLPGAIATPLPGASPIAKFDLTLSVSESADGLTCQWEYAADLFEPATVGRLAGRFARLLEALVAAPQTPVGELDLLTPDEQVLLAAWNATDADYPRELTLAELFEAQVARTPDSTALVCAERALTYAELNRRANRLAHTLIAQGVGPDLLVGLCLERSLELVIAILAVLKAGGAYLPLDPDYPAERLRFMLEDSAVPVLLTQPHLRVRLPPHQAQVLCLDPEPAAAPFADRQAPIDTNPPRRATPEHLAYCLFTSGSTGQPKGVLVTQAALANHIHWLQRTFPLAPADRVLQKTSISFDVSVWEFFAPLFVGGTLVMAAPQDHRDPRALVQRVQEHGITVLQTVPSLLRLDLAEGLLEQAPALRYLFSGGEPLTADLAAACAGSCIRLINFYGPTEATIDTTFWEWDGTPGAIPIGRPIANTRIYVLDAYRRALPLGVPGELCIAGDGLARGYLNRPGLTAERFVEVEVLGRTERVYRTGDLARWRPDGNLEYLGRLDHQVKLRGLRIELGEIEAALAAHPLIREAAVLLVGEGERQCLVAYLTLDGQPHRTADAGPDLPAALRANLLAQLPDYMVPASFTVLKAFPLTHWSQVKDFLQMSRPMSTGRLLLASGLMGALQNPQ